MAWHRSLNPTIPHRRHTLTWRVPATQPEPSFYDDRIATERISPSSYRLRHSVYRTSSRSYAAMAGFLGVG